MTRLLLGLADARPGLTRKKLRFASKPARRPTLSGQAGVFLAGALVGTLLDRVHVATGVLSYAHPVLFGQAIWVPAVFGIGGLILVNSHRLFVERSAPPPPAIRTLAPPAALFAAAYLATGLWPDRPGLLATGLVVAWIIRLAARPTADRVVAGAAIAIGGPLFEAALSATGGFAYRDPDLLGVPCWLPALYLHASLLTRQIYLVFRTYIMSPFMRT